MLIDLHVHPPVAAQVPGGLRGAFLRLLTRDLGGEPLEARRRFLAWLEASALDRAVLLALDGSYTPDGRPDPEGTVLRADNDAVATLAQASPKALFGASIHPYRRDALAELERVLARGACLVKWIPSAQNIDPAHPACLPFYEALAQHRVPLLCHTGPEHTLRTSRDAFNHPLRLVPALRRGVTVIMAHCAARLWIYESTGPFQAWRRLAREFEHCYGDLGAFTVMTRHLTLDGLLKDPVLRDKLLFGSDFPAWTLPSQFLPRLGWRRYRALAALSNPFDRARETLRAFGVPEAVFSRAGTLLRGLPAGTRA